MTGTAAEPENYPVPLYTGRNGAITFSKRGLSRATRGTWGKGRKGGNHSIPIPEWVSGYAKYFSCQSDEHIWLPWWWGNEAINLELERKKAKQLGSFSGEGGFGKALGKGMQILCLWRQLLSRVKEKYLCKEDTYVTQDNGLPWREVSSTWGN